jgi:transposase InsO family protein
VDHLH